MELHELIRQHGRSVAFVFRKMGITAPVTPANVVNIAALYGEVFIDALERQISLEEKGYSHLEGDDYNWIDYSSAGDDPDYNNPTGDMANTKVLAPVVVTTKAKKATSGLKNILSTIAETLGAYAGARRNATIHKDDGTNIFGEKPPVQQQKTNSFLMIALVLIAVLTIVLIASKHKK